MSKAKEEYYAYIKRCQEAKIWYMPEIFNYMEELEQQLKEKDEKIKELEEEIENDTINRYDE